MSALPSIVRETTQLAASAVGAPMALVMSPQRFYRLCAARVIAMGMLRDGPLRIAGRPASLSWLGQHFGRDHTTVLHSIRRYRGWCEDLGMSATWEGDGAVSAERIAALAKHPAIAAMVPITQADVDRVARRQERKAKRIELVRRMTEAFAMRQARQNPAVRLEGAL